MPFDTNCHLWPNNEDKFFTNKQLKPIRQKGPHCVSTVLSILTGAKPEDFQGVVNTQDPLSWSDTLQNWGMKLAYCPTDVRKLRFYMQELISLDDLFTVSYYTTLDKTLILGDPNAHGWVCSSHIVVLHRDKIFDPQTGSITSAVEHDCNNNHTKRIFRVVPSDYLRSI